MSGESPEPRQRRQPGDREPAPGELATVQAFLNTRWDLRRLDRGDTLASPAALQGWLKSRELIGERERRLAPADLDRALAVREGLRALAYANNGQALNGREIDAM